MPDARPVTARLDEPLEFAVELPMLVALPAARMVDNRFALLVELDTELAINFIPSCDVQMAFFATIFKPKARTAPARRPRIHRFNESSRTSYWRSFSAICGTALAWANIAVPVCTNMFSFANCVLSVATSTSMMTLFAADRLLFNVANWLL
jgi:hypothetical protein